MENFTAVRPEHLNVHGALFGGQMLAWADEYSWLAASRDFPNCRFVTIAINKAEFKEAVHCGAILRFDMQQKTKGTTSVTYNVEVYATTFAKGTEERVFATEVTFVNIDENEQKAPIV